MTDTRIESWLEARRRIHAAASDGPWEAEHEEGNITSPTQGNVFEVFSWTDADATAAVDAFNALPTFFAVVEAVLELHQRDEYGQCTQCWESVIGEIREDWPCAELRALEAVIGDE